MFLTMAKQIALRYDRYQYIRPYEDNNSATAKQNATSISQPTQSCLVALGQSATRSVYAVVQVRALRRHPKRLGCL